MKLSVLIYINLALLLSITPAQASIWDKHQANLGQATTEVAFSPDMGATDLVVKAISEAQKTIRVAAYSFTSKPIAKALLDASKRGIDVKLVVDKSDARSQNNAAKFLANSGIPTRVDYEYSIMHNKFLIIDEKTVETGSFNYSSSAERRNSENVLVIRNDPTLAKQYENEWQRLWNESEKWE